MSELLLSIDENEYEGPERWRWRLSEPGVGVLAEHQVNLDTDCWEYRAFVNLSGYLEGHIPPDQAVARDAEIVGALGRWIAVEVFGPIGPALARVRPVTVRVVVPIKARELRYRPLELAHIDGRPLSVQHVTLVYQEDDESPGDADAVTDCLRVLGVFSLPADETPLHLRRERQNLVDVFDRISTSMGRAVELRVVQYGVNHDRLRRIMAEQAWDVVHLAGHGDPGSLVLEGDDGTATPVSTAELVELLGGKRRPPKLVVISACHSAAVVDERDRLDSTPLVPVTPDRRPEVTDLATGLARELRCAVLAMRYSVVDDFAIELARELYQVLAGESRTLAAALGLAMSRVLAGPPSEQCPASSAATPALFGARAAGLRLTAPLRSEPESGRGLDRRPPGFDSQPDYFVGRLSVMARASAALAERSKHTAVLLYGMPGIGKTACALELAYTHRDAFDSMAWCVMPDDPRLVTPAMTVRRGLTLGDLAGQLRRGRVLLVLDNLGSLLDDTGRWRDPRWGAVISALTEHDGPGRVIMTSRRSPRSLASKVRVLTVDALAPAEARQLVRVLPNLHGDLSGRALRLAQGHPGLLQQINDQAADPDRLGVLLDAADQAWGQVGGVPEEPGGAAADHDHLHVLRAWIRTAAEALPASGKELLLFLSCLCEDDRSSLVLRHIRPSSEEDIALLADRGLLTVQPGSDTAPDTYQLVPSVAEVGRELADEAYQASVDNRLAYYWTGLFQEFLGDDGRSETTWLVVHAAVSAARYLVRLGHLVNAAGLLEQALVRDRSPEYVAEALPLLEMIAAAPDADRQPGVLHVLARAVEPTDPARAEQLMHRMLDLAREQGNHKSAALAASALSGYCERSGRMEEALRFADDRIAFTELAGLGSWSQLAARVQRLGVHAIRAHPQHVRAEARRLLARMDRLPERAATTDAAKPFRVRENLLDICFQAAVRLEHWQEALEFAKRIRTAVEHRGASPREIAQSWYTFHGPLLRLGHLDAALDSLVKAKKKFEEADDAYGLGMVLGGLAGIENHLGHGEVALDLSRDSLRYHYRAGDAQAIQTAHHNLGGQLVWFEKDDAGLAHLMAAALICRLLADRYAEESLAAIGYFASLIEHPSLPTNLAGLCERVTRVPGVDLQALVHRLAPDTYAATRVFTQLRAEAQAQLSA